jgi:hypothetical protein
MNKIEVVLKTPETPEAYYDLVQQALFEMAELRESLEYDELDGNVMHTAQGVLERIEQPLQELAAAMRNGTYEFSNNDLAFIAPMRRQSERAIPFKHLLNLINSTHRLGLGVKL